MSSWLKLKIRSCYNLVNFTKIRRWWTWRLSETAKFQPILVILLLCLCNEANAQQFTRSCQDPLIQNHITTGHTYCFHACGYFGAPATQDFSTCTANGNCLCNYPCDSTAPANPFDAGICPPIASEPPDPDLAAPGRCTQFCASSCPGGQGSICGESLGALGPNADVYAKICTCYCPPQPCAPPTTQISIVLLKKPLLPLLIKTKLVVWKVVLKKLLKICFVFLKLCFLYFIKLFLFGLYYYAFYEWISWEVTTIFRGARWVFGFFGEYLSGVF